MPLKTIYGSLFESVTDPGSYGYQGQEDYDQFYEFGMESTGRPNWRTEFKLKYNRRALLSISRIKANNLVSQYSIQQSDEVIILGCGFNWIGEIMEHELGVSKVIGVETSYYIHECKTQPEDAAVESAVKNIQVVQAHNGYNAGDFLTPFQDDGLGMVGRFSSNGNSRCRNSFRILDEDLKDVASRNRVKAHVGANPIVITFEGMLNSYPDGQEMDDFISNVEGLGAGKIIHHVYDNFWNIKTLAEWEALYPSHEFAFDNDINQ